MLTGALSVKADQRTRLKGCDTSSSACSSGEIAIPSVDPRTVGTAAANYPRDLSHLTQAPRKLTIVRAEIWTRRRESAEEKKNLPPRRRGTGNSIWMLRMRFRLHGSRAERAEE